MIILLVIEVKDEEEVETAVDREEDIITIDYNYNSHEKQSTKNLFLAYS